MPCPFPISPLILLTQASIVRMGVGYDRLDRVALAARGVTVCNVPGASSKFDVAPKHTHILTLQTMAPPRLPTTPWHWHSPSGEEC